MCGVAGYLASLAVTLGRTVEGYDPSQPPHPAEWLALDEQERALLVEQHHRGAGVDLPNAKLHAVIHVIVENQLAANDEPVVRALARLRKDGLSRHDAIHAIGSVTTEYIFEALHAKEKSTAPTPARYYAAIEGLAAAKWRNGE